MNEAGYEYFLSLLDDAKRVVCNDTLGEGNPFVDYTIEKKEEAIINKTSDKPVSLKDLYLNCHSCNNWINRDHRCLVGRGALHPLVLFVVDKTLDSGAMLSAEDGVMINTWSNAIKLEKTKECHLTSIIKCPGESSEVNDDCIKILKEQVKSLSPKVVFFLGNLGAKILGFDSIEKARENVSEFEGAVAVVSYPPMMVQRDPRLKAAIWNDLKKVAFYAGIKERRC